MSKKSKICSLRPYFHLIKTDFSIKIMRKLMSVIVIVTDWRCVEKSLSQKNNDKYGEKIPVAGIGLLN